MYVIRRVWETKPREARRAASIVAEVGKIYEDSGQRDPVKVYFNSGTLPGEKNRVYMEWTAEVIESTKTSARPTVSPSSSRVCGVKLPTPLTWHPGRSQEPSKTGVVAVVAVQMISAPSTAARGLETTTSCVPSRRVIVATKLVADSGVGQ